MDFIQRNLINLTVNQSIKTNLQSATYMLNAFCTIHNNLLKPYFTADSIA